MNPETWLVRGTIWLALSLYVGAELATARWQGGRASLARMLNTAGCAAFLAHVAAAFHFHHGWSHAAAYEATALQTAEFTGWHWGGGLFVNYLFAALWLAEVAWRWGSPDNHRRRPRWRNGLARGGFLFMIFNGAVVFVRGPARWYGLALCLILLGCWWPRPKAATNPQGTTGLPSP
ncbi:MAG: hypothetical protein KIT22_20135 [Verrucomicrobiae bacterium]|nr:hypothetical protein [Verrucomicrobiae bacterium]